jgi:hypothetical protein
MEAPVIRPMVPVIRMGSTRLQAVALQKLRGLERQQRLLARVLATGVLPRQLLVDLTVASFRMEQIAVKPDEVAQALAKATPLRTRHQRRIRTHITILLQIYQALRKRTDLEPTQVLRWYTSLSGGLSIPDVDASCVARLTQCLRQINSPALRVQSAVKQIAAVHVRLLSDPVFPGFNGVLARLLLQYHLGRCLLPPVMFDAERDRSIASGEEAMAGRLTALIGEAYQRLFPQGAKG